jgi:hypothetical protein
MTHRDPCCWKWHSSPNQISRFFLAASRISFFIFLLNLWVRFRNKGPWFSPTKPHVMEQPTALTFAQENVILLGQMVAEKLSIPQILHIALLPWTLAKIVANRFADTLIQRRRTSRPWRFLESRKAAPLKASHPILDGPWALPEQIGHLVTTESGTHQQDAMQPVVVSRLVGAHDLLLYRDSHNLCIFDIEPAHIVPSFLLHNIAERSQMRNYL